MVDTPSGPLTAEQAVIANEITRAQQDLTNATSNYSSVVNDASNVLNRLQSSLQNAGKDLNQMDTLTSGATAAFFGLGTAVIKAQDQFRGFETSNKYVNTFGGHVNDLRQMLASGGTAASVATQKISELSNAFKKAGGSSSQLAAAQKMGSVATLNFLKNMFDNADNALKMQNAYIHLSASTGNLSTVFAKSGNNLQNMTNLIDEQNKMMDLSKDATNSTVDQIQDYYMALGKIPKALQETVSSGTSAGGTMSMLTATIKMAKGSGRDYNQVIQDLHQSFKSFGLVGEDSLKFVSRFSELSNNLGIELDDMRSGLLGATSAFKDLTDAGVGAHNMTESISSIMNDYVKGLKESGMTGQHAVDVVKNMTGAMAGLNVAQRAFLSAQTGGPGGLMGAARIEGMLRKGDTEGVMKMMMSSMQKMGLGKEVTLEEAEKSESAAQTRQKQIALLQQGPLGSIAKTQEDAGRLLEVQRMIREGKTVPGGIAGLDSKGLQGAIEKGSAIERTSDTTLSHMSTDISAIRHRLEPMSLRDAQRAFTAAPTPNEPPVTDSQRELRERITSRSRDAVRQGGTHAEMINNQMGKAGPIKDASAQNIKESVSSFVNMLSEGIPVIESVFDTLKQSYDEHAFTKKTTLKDVKNEIDQRREFQRNSMQRRNKPYTAGATLATATRGQVPTNNNTNATSTTKAPREVIVSEEGSTGRIKVEVKVYEENGQSHSITPAR
jgi:hypothetical protein